MSYLNVLFLSDKVLVAQTHAGVFDKYSPDDVYGEFNVALHVLDDASKVLQNRAKLLTALNKLTCGQVHQIHWLNQIHSDKVVDAHLTYQLGIVSADALMTNQKHQALAIMTADCVPVALFTENGEQVACVHAGWQGLASGILANTYQAMQSHACQLKAVIGACISQKNYEIPIELAHNIINMTLEKQLIHGSFAWIYKQIICEVSADKCLIDIVALTKLQLAKLGIDIIGSDVPCSYEMPNLYSYRQQTHAHKSATGRMALIVVGIN